MYSSTDTPVLIIGGGPVGLLLALDLAWRNIPVTVLEKRREHEPPSVKCNHISSRSMEIFRRLGLVSKVRAVGLPDDYPNDVVIRTRATGYELMRIPIPNRLERYSSTEGPDTGWPTPEPPHRANQIYLDPILYEEAKNHPLIRILFQHEGMSFTQNDKAVTTTVKNLVTKQVFTLGSQYLIGCEGGKSATRKQIGAKLSGDAVIQRVQSTYIRAPQLLDAIGGKPAWMSYIYTPERAGNLVAIDGRETWLIHNYLLAHEKDFDSVDRDACIRHLLGVDQDFDIELLAEEDWFGRRLVADRFRRGRVFICGDAAHLWVPYAGYGMNAGLADAMNLSWTLASVINGWGGQAMLDCYQQERQPITDQVSRFAMKHAEGAIAERTSITPEIEEDSKRGEQLRRQVGEAAYRLHVQQFACAGLNYGYYYDNSPVIAYDDGQAPAYTMHDYTPSTVPGCRLPHFWLAPGQSLYDRLGPEFTLLRFDQGIDVSQLEQVMTEHKIPLTVLDVPLAEKPAPYRHSLVLVRPDAHIAWRGDTLPEQVANLVRHVTGHDARQA